MYTQYSGAGKMSFVNFLKGLYMVTLCVSENKFIKKSNDYCVTSTAVLAKSWLWTVSLYGQAGSIPGSGDFVVC